MPQHLDALARANAVRVAAHQLRKRIAAGDLTVVEGLDHPDAQAMRVAHLLMSQSGWAERKTSRLLNAAHIRFDQRVRDLTPRQRRALVARLTGVDLDLIDDPDAWALMAPPENRWRAA